MRTTTRAVIGMVQQDERVCIIRSIGEPAQVGPRLLTAWATPERVEELLARRDGGWRHLEDGEEGRDQESFGSVHTFLNLSDLLSQCTHEGTPWVYLYHHQWGIYVLLYERQWVYAPLATWLDVVEDTASRLLELKSERAAKIIAELDDLLIQVRNARIAGDYDTPFLLHVSAERQPQLMECLSQMALHDVSDMLACMRQLAVVREEEIVEASRQNHRGPINSCVFELGKMQLQDGRKLINVMPLMVQRDLFFEYLSRIGLWGLA